MQRIQSPRVAVLLALFIGTILLIVMAPAAAHAAWTGADASIVDPNGSGYVGLLNVSVANHAANDSAAVTELQLSDDGSDWYHIAYTGEAQDWVLSGASGAKTLFVRFAAADGTVSPVVEAHINVDTQGPRSEALRAVRAVRGAPARFVYTVADQMSPLVKASIVIRGTGVRKTVLLGWVRVGEHHATAKLRLPAGRYRWSVQAVDLALWAQESQVSRSLVVK